MRALDLAVIGAYFLVTISIGLHCSRNNRGSDGYFLGGRNFPGWAIGLSFIGSTISSVTFIAFPADSFKTAWVRLVPNFAYPFVIILAGLLFVPLFRSGKVHSAYHYLSLRFGPAISVYAALIYLLAQVVRSSMILYLLAVLLSSITGFPTPYCILIAAGTTAIYTVKGGFGAVVWTDVIQMIILALGACACIITILYALPGGLNQILAEASAAGKLSFQDLNPATGRLEAIPSGFSLTEKTTLMLVLVGMSQFISGQLDQDSVQRWCSAKSTREARKSMVVLGFGALPIWAAFMFLGTCLWVYFQNFPSDVSTAILDGNRKAEDILPHFIVTVLPVGICGLVASAALAAAMASLSSSISASGMVWINDLYRAYIEPRRDDRHYVRTAKIAALVLSLIMTGGAWTVFSSNAKTVMELTIILLALVGGGISGAFLFGLFSRRGDARCVLCGIGCTALFTAYAVAGQAGWVNEIINPYYTSILSNVVMFSVCWFTSFFFCRKERDLSGLTVWDRPTKQTDPIAGGLPNLGKS
jgi:SSS family solute:Na+ symporter